MQMTMLKTNPTVTARAYAMRKHVPLQVALAILSELDMHMWIPFHVQIFTEDKDS